MHGCSVVSRGVHLKGCKTNYYPPTLLGVSVLAHSGDAHYLDYTQPSTHISHSSQPTFHHPIHPTIRPAGHPSNQPASHHPVIQPATRAWYCIGATAFCFGAPQVATAATGRRPPKPRNQKKSFPNLYKSVAKYVKTFQIHLNAYKSTSMNSKPNKSH